jgi:hypothetical protein
MRTTLEIDDDVLSAAKSLAKAANTTAGRIISDTMRRAIQNGLAEQRPLTGEIRAAEPQAVYGFKALTPAGQHIVTPDMVRALRDEQGE